MIGKEDACPTSLCEIEYRVEFCANLLDDVWTNTSMQIGDAIWNSNGMYRTTFRDTHSTLSNDMRFMRFRIIEK
jgi:hypothetical protein